MRHTYKTKGTCSVKIDFDIEDGKLHDVSYTGGCNGNLKAVAALVEGQDIEDVVRKLKGIKCGIRNTSCADQLARALEEVEK